MKSCVVNGTVNNTDFVVLDKWVETHDFLLGELADCNNMLGGPNGQGSHYSVPPIIGTGEPRAVEEERQVVDSHYLVAN